MNKKALFGAVVAAILGAVLVLPAAGQSPQVKFKFYGGYGYLLGGDLNSGTEGMSNLWLDFFAASGGSNSGSFQPAHYGLQFGGDIVLMFSPNIGIGLGAESLGASKSSTVVTTLGAESVTTSIEAKASAIPLKASLYLCAPFGSGARMTLHFGVGYYLAKMSNDINLKEGSEFMDYSNSAEASALGFHGGLGFEFDLTPNVSLFIEAQGRYAKIGGFEGDYKMSDNYGTDLESGRLYYLEEEGLLPLFYSIIVCQDTAPVADAWIKNIREAKIDFSGVTALGGLIIRF
jgi:opacity protein-like surface antigen